MNKLFQNLDPAPLVEGIDESPEKELFSASVSSDEKKADPIPEFPRNVHPAIKAIVAPFPESRRPAMAIMSLAYLGTMAGNARFLYRNQEEHATGFECCLVASQAMGKSALTRLKRDLLSRIITHDKEVRDKMDEYADECLAAGDGQKKRNPHYATRLMMPSTTLAQFYQNIKDAKGERCLIICPEIDSLNKANNWSKDGGANERLMFDTEEGGQDTKSHGGTSAQVPIACNIAESGTPVAVRRHFKNAEDGLVTRIAFCSFPEDMDENEEEHRRTKKNLEELLKIQDILLSEAQGDPIAIPNLKKQQLEWCKEKERVADASGNESIKTFRKRAAVMGFRAGCILYLLDGKKLTRKALEFANWVSEYVLYFQLKYYGKEMNESIEANREIMNAPVTMLCRNSWFFVQLADRFSYNQVKALYTHLGKKATGYRTTVARWEKNGWIERIDNGTFCKTEAGMALGNVG